MEREKIEIGQELYYGNKKVKVLKIEKKLVLVCMDNGITMKVKPEELKQLLHG